MSEASVSKGGRTRAEIVQAAYRLFLELGYHGTSMRQIAQKAGIALGGIYNHFASKEDIFVAVLMERPLYLDIIPAINAAHGASIEELVRNAAALMIRGLDERPDFQNMMFIELVEFKGQHIPQLFQIAYPQIIGFAQQLMQLGEENLRPIPVPIVLRAFIGLFFSYFITDRLIGTQMPPELQANAFDNFVDIFLHGILAEN